MTDAHLIKILDVVGGEAWLKLSSAEKREAIDQLDYGQRQRIIREFNALLHLIPAAKSVAKNLALNCPGNVKAIMDGLQKRSSEEAELYR